MGSTTQNEVTNALTAAMKIMADSSAQSKLATLTVEAEVTAIVDKGNGVYKVSYLGSAFEATAANKEIEYKEGDNVYVIIPNGDFGKNKIILSSADTVKTTTYESTGGADFCDTVDNLLASFSDTRLEVNSFKLSDKDEVFDTAINQYYTLMNGVLNTTRKLKIKCKIQTNITASRRNTGNYGIRIAIGGAKHSETNSQGYETYSQYEKVFDIADILGDPYKLTFPTSQTFDITIPKDFYLPNSKDILVGYPLVSVTLFCYDFPGAKENPDIFDNDIFCSELEVYGLSPAGVSEDNLGYYSVLTASDGNYFNLGNEVTDEKEMTKVLTISAYLNQKSININYFDCYWYEEDFRVVEGEPGYHEYGGNGWRILNESSKTSAENRLEEDYITNVYQWSVQAPFDSQKYKCVLVKDNIVLNSTITLITNNSNNSLSFELKNANGIGVTSFSNKIKEDPVYFEIKAQVNNDPIKSPIKLASLKKEVSVSRSNINLYRLPRRVSFTLQLLNSKGEFIGNDNFYSTLFNTDKFFSTNEDILYKTEEISDSTQILYVLGSFYPYQLDEGDYTIACSVYQVSEGIEEKPYVLFTRYIPFTISNSYIAAKAKYVDGNKTFSYNKYGIYEKTDKWLKNKIHQDFGLDVVQSTKVFDSDIENKYKTLLPGGEEEPIKIFLYKENGLEFTPAEYASLTFEWSFYKDSLFLGGNTGGAKKEKEGDSYLTNFHLGTELFNYGNVLLSRVLIDPSDYTFPYKYDTLNGLITIIKGNNYKEEEVNLYPEQIRDSIISIPSYYNSYMGCNNIFPYGVKKYYNSFIDGHDKIYVKIKGPEYLIGSEDISLEIPFSFKKESNPNGFSKKNYFKIVPSASANIIPYYLSPTENKLQLYYYGREEHYSLTSTRNEFRSYNSSTIGIINSDTENFETYSWTFSIPFSLLVFDEFMELDKTTINPDNLSWEIVGEAGSHNSLGGFSIYKDYSDPYSAYLEINPNYWNNSGIEEDFKPNGFFIKVKYLNDTTEEEVTNIPVVAYYPVEIILSSDQTFIPVLQGGFDQVLYSKAGMNPTQDKDAFYFNELRLYKGFLGYIDPYSKLFSQTALNDYEGYDFSGGTTMIQNVNGNHSLNLYQNLSYKILKDCDYPVFMGITSGGLDVSNTSNNITEENSYANSEYLTCSWDITKDLQEKSYIYKIPNKKDVDYKVFDISMGMTEDNYINFNNFRNQLNNSLNNFSNYCESLNNFNISLKQYSTLVSDFLSGFYINQNKYVEAFNKKRLGYEYLLAIQNYLVSIQNIINTYPNKNFGSYFNDSDIVNTISNVINNISYFISDYGRLGFNVNITVENLSNRLIEDTLLSINSSTAEGVTIDASVANIIVLLDKYNESASSFKRSFPNWIGQYSSLFAEHASYISNFYYDAIDQIQNWDSIRDYVELSYPNCYSYFKDYSEFLNEYIKPCIDTSQKLGFYFYPSAEAGDQFWQKSSSSCLFDFLDKKIEAYQKYYEELQKTVLTLRWMPFDWNYKSLRMGPSRYVDVQNYTVYSKPIVNVNSFEEESELAFMWDWDGTSTYIGNDHILTPLIGAGVKNNSNKFSGMLMGKAERNGRDLIGLLGYNQSEQTMFLNAKDGSAIFGKNGGGQIILDPSRGGLIYSQNYWREYGVEGKPSNYSNSNLNMQGMLIDLQTPQIRFGNGNFVVTPDGYITAAGGGKIAGWNIDNIKIWSSNTAGGITIDSGRSEPTLDENGNKVYTDGQGKIYGGSHSSLGSTVIGFYLSSDGLSIGSKVYIDSNGVMRLGAGAVANSGNFWTIDGGDNSYISYGTVGSNGSVYIGTDAIKLGSQFSVDNNGYLEAKNVKATGGSIGGWHIAEHVLYSTDGKVALYDDGRITGGSEGKTFTLSGNGLSFTGANGINIDANTGTFKGTGFELSNAGLAISAGTITLGSRFKVTSDGTLTASNVDLTGKITATSGTIGGCTISGGVLKVKNANIDGTISADHIDVESIAAGISQIGDGTYRLKVGSLRWDGQDYVAICYGSGGAVPCWGITYYGSIVQLTS